MDYGSGTIDMQYGEVTTWRPREAQMGAGGGRTASGRAVPVKGAALLEAQQARTRHAGSIPFAIAAGTRVCRQCKLAHRTKIYCRVVRKHTDRPNWNDSSEGPMPPRTPWKPRKALPKKVPVAPPAPPAPMASVVGPVPIRLVPSVVTVSYSEAPAPKRPRQL